MKSRNKQSGIAALMLVIWTSLALSGVLFGLVSRYGVLLTAYKIEQGRKLARASALFCRDLLLVELAGNARYEPIVGPSSDQMYKNTACHTVSFTSIGDATGETKVVSIEGKHIPSGSIFDIESKIFVANTIGTTPIVLYTKETFEK